MTHAIFRQVFSAKALIRAGVMALSLSSIGAAHSQTYHTPAYNFHQNNWMAGGGG
jgi:hypothetical protein